MFGNIMQPINHPQPSPWLSSAFAGFSPNGTAVPFMGMSPAWYAAPSMGAAGVPAVTGGAFAALMAADESSTTISSRSNVGADMLLVPPPPPPPRPQSSTGPAGIAPGAAALDADAQQGVGTMHGGGTDGLEASQHPVLLPGGLGVAGAWEVPRHVVAAKCSKRDVKELLDAEDVMLMSRQVSK